jgi:beta-N-acetylhexosaminidase
MNALSGDPADRAVAALEAGCDLALYCTGRLEETRAVLQAAPPLAPSLRARLDGTMAALAAARVEAVDPALAEGRLTELLAGPVA